MDRKDRISMWANGLAEIAEEIGVICTDSDLRRKLLDAKTEGLALMVDEVVEQSSKQGDDYPILKVSGNPTKVERSSAPAVLRRLRKAVVDCWEIEIAAKKRFEVDTPGRRIHQAMADTYQHCCAKIDRLLAECEGAEQECDGCPGCSTNDCADGYRPKGRAIEERQAAWPPMGSGDNRREGEPQDRSGLQWLAWFCGMVYQHASWVPPGDARLATEIAGELANAEPQPRDADPFAPSEGCAGPVSEAPQGSRRCAMSCEYVQKLEAELAKERKRVAAHAALVEDWKSRHDAKEAELAEARKERDEDLNKVGAELAECRKERGDYIDGIHAVLIAAGGSEDVDELEKQINAAGPKPSDFVRQQFQKLRKAQQQPTPATDAEVEAWFKRCAVVDEDGLVRLTRQDIEDLEALMSHWAPEPVSAEQASDDSVSLREHDRVCGQIIEERDEMEERVNAIAVALDLSDSEREWSSCNDVGVRCVERAEELALMQRRARVDEQATNNMDALQLLACELGWRVNGEQSVDASDLLDYVRSDEFESRARVEPTDDESVKAIELRLRNALAFGGEHNEKRTLYEDVSAMLRSRARVEVPEDLVRLRNRMTTTAASILNTDGDAERIEGYSEACCHWAAEIDRILSLRDGAEPAKVSTQRAETHKAIDAVLPDFNDLRRIMEPLLRMLQHNTGLDPDSKWQAASALAVTECERFLVENGAEPAKDDQPNLGLATTGQMLEELKARAHVGGYESYRTVDGDSNARTLVEDPAADPQPDDGPEYQEPQIINLMDALKSSLQREVERRREAKRGGGNG